MDIQQFIRKKQISISSEDWNKLIETNPNAVEELSKLIKTGKISYPYKRLFTTPEMIMTAFEKLQKLIIRTYHPKTLNIYNFDGEDPLTFNMEYTVIDRGEDDYDNFGFLTDIFQESVRVKCHRSDLELSSYEYWKQCPNQVFCHCMDMHKNINTNTLRESLFDLHYEVGTFRLSVATTVIRLFHAKYILDPFSGWGDRLISALACNVKSYQGIDANSELFDGYKKIEQIFNKNTNVQMINSPIEDVKSDDINECDLIFTSPPYFDLETYSGDLSLQSNRRYPKLNKWIKWLVKSLKKCWKKLKVGGHMAIAINDSSSTKYVQKILDLIHEWDNSEYKGCLAYAARKGILLKSPQPIWIWEKSKK